MRFNRKLCVLCAFALLLGVCVADVHLISPGGSNNRLNEANRNRNNANRLFDSENNARPGINVANLYFYSSSILRVMWTQQHGCGPDQKNSNCELIFQYACDDTLPNIRDGTDTDQVPDDAKSSKSPKFGQHESYTYFQDCKKRQRNKGLYVGDQRKTLDNRNKQSATYTRQNANGNDNNNRFGFECPEERDYYPYWHPSPWKDIGVFISNRTEEEFEQRCKYYQEESQNVKPRGHCTTPDHNNKVACETAGGEWLEDSAFGIEQPFCRPAPWGKDNYHGHTLPFGAKSEKLEYPYFDWTVPDLGWNSSVAQRRCALRLRYNITTNDLGMVGQGPTWQSRFFMDATMNNPEEDAELQPMGEYLKQKLGYDVDFNANPSVDIGLPGGLKLKLAMNFQQFFRTFEDRTHTFLIKPRPAGLSNDVIWNVNVRGKRGNIAQNYPTPEYDFSPNNLDVPLGAYVHMQWAGSNTNNNNNAGQGQQGTDRTNVVIIPNLKHNVPKKNDSAISFLKPEMRRMFAVANQSSGSMSELDDASTYFDGGLLKVDTLGEFYYISTRNNAFSNRAQKAVLIVHHNGVDLTLFIPLLMAFVLLVGLVAALVIYAKTHPAFAYKVKNCFKFPKKAKYSPIDPSPVVPADAVAPAAKPTDTNAAAASSSSSAAATASTSGSAAAQ